MHREFEQKIKMLKAVQYTLSTNSDITSSFAREIGMYDEYIYRLREIFSKQSSMQADKSGKLSTEDNIKIHCNRIAAALRAYGAMTGRNELLTNSTIKEKNIDEKTETELYKNGHQILNIASENKMNLTLFGITDKVLNDFENMLYMFGKLLGFKSKYEIVNSKEDELEKICDLAIAFLEKTVDILVEKKKNLFPKFYNEYKSARSLEIDDLFQNQYYFA